MQPSQSPEFTITLIQQAELAVQIARDNYGVTLDYTPESLAVLNQLLQEAHAAVINGGKNAPVPTRTIQVWGAYLGETLRRSNEGEWKQTANRGSDFPYYVTSPAGDEFPFEQVRLRVVNGYTDEQIKQTFAPRVKPEKKKNSLTCLWVGLALLVLAGLVITPTVMFAYQVYKTNQARARAAYEAPFIPNLPVYMAQYKPTLDDLPLITGKFLIVDMDNGTVSDLHYELPEELRATSPADLTIVVQQSCGSAESGIYAGTGIAANRQSCRLTLVDPVNRQTLMWQDFIGSEIRQEIHVDENGLPVEDTGGALSTDLMIHWLEMWVE